MIHDRYTLIPPHKKDCMGTGGRFRMCDYCHRVSFRDPFDLFPSPQCSHDVQAHVNFVATMHKAGTEMSAARNRILIDEIEKIQK